MTSHDPSAGEIHDRFEERLTSRIRGLSEHGVRPIDAAALAHAAALEGGRPGFASRLASRLGAGRPIGRLAWLVGGAALLGAVVLGGASLAGGGLLGLVHQPTQSVLTAVVPSPTVVPSPARAPSATPAPTATPAPQTVDACTAAHLSASVVGWTGAAGSRIADVTIKNIGTAACALATLDRPQLVDGHEAVLIDGAAPKDGGSITLASGATARTEVADSNYCGPAPVAPVSVAFVLPNGERVVAEPVSSTDLSGVAPCNGPTEPGLVTMHPWGR